MQCKEGGCFSIGCEGGRYCGPRFEECSPQQKRLIQEALDKVFNKDKIMKLNTKPYNQAELEAARAQGFTSIPDWSESLTKLRLGQRRMDDALPGSDLDGAREAYKLLVEAVAGFHVFFAARGIDLAK